MLIIPANTLTEDAGNDNGIFGYGTTGSLTAITNLVYDAGVVATDVSGVGTARSGIAACSYGGDKGIFGGNAGSAVTNLVSNVGVVADAATIKLRRRIPYHGAVEFLMTGRWMDVKEAKHWGLVNEITNKKDLLKRAWEIADKISKGPNLIYSSIKDILRETENEKEIPSFKILRSLETVKKVYGSEDLREGASSFVKKTDPNWKDK